MSNVERLRIRMVVFPYAFGVGWEGSPVDQVELIQVGLIDTDGVEGTGFTYAYRGGSAVVAMLENALSDLLFDHPIDEWAQFLRVAKESTHRIGRGVVFPALSALDIAAWDLRAIRLGQPLAQVLGGAWNRPRFYRSGWIQDLSNPNEVLIREAHRWIDAGFEGLKCRVSRVNLRSDIGRLYELREAIPSHIEIMVDANESLDLVSAVNLANELTSIGALWLEEPLPSFHRGAYRHLASLRTIPIAGGEHFMGESEFYDSVRDCGLSLLQPDAALTGGITEWMRISTIAEASGVSLAPHSLAELHIHPALATRCTWIECYPLLDALLNTTITPKKYLPEGSGLGIDWDWDTVERYTVYERVVQKG